MKKTIILALLVLMLSGSVFAASSTVGGQFFDGFSRTGSFSIISNPEPRIGLAKTSDGGFVVAGTTQGSGLLLRYDSAANLLWQRKLSGISSAQDVIERPNGDLALAGGLGGSRQIALVADSSGNVLSSTGYRNFFSNDAHGVIPRTDGTYYIVGFEGGRGAATLLNVQAGGSFTRSRYRGAQVPCLVPIDPGSRDQFTSNDVEKTHDGQVLMIGATDLQGANCPTYIKDLADAVLVKINESGAVMWSMHYGDNSSAKNSEFYAAKSLVDGSIIAVGSNNEGSAGDHDAYVVKTDQNGNVLWQTLYGGIGRDIGYDILASSDGGFVIAGTTTSFGANGQRDGWIFKINSAGAVLWQKRFGGVHDDRLSRVIELDDGSYVAAGMTSSFGVENADVWLVKLDSNGNAASSCQANPDTTAVMSGAVTGSYSHFYFQEVGGMAVTAESTAGVNPALQVQSQCPSVCSDDVIQFGEACDTSNFFAVDDHCFSGSARSCKTDCSACEARCGNGVKETSEQCDDTNVNNGDGCSSACQLEDNDGDGAYDLDEIKFGTDRFDPANYPVQVYLRAFGHLYLEHYPGSGWQQQPYILFNPEVGAQITSVTDQNNNPVQLLQPHNGQPYTTPFTGLWVVRKNASMTALKLDMERQSYVYAGNNYNQLVFRGSTSVDIAQVPPYPAIGAQGNATFGVNIYVQKPYNANAATGAITGLVVAEDGSDAGEGVPLGSSEESSAALNVVGSTKTCCLIDDASSPTGHSWPLTNGSSVPVRLERSNKQTLKGSELNIYEPVVLGEGEQQLNYIYATRDNYWDVTTSLSLPDGCSADKASASVHVDESTELATFNVYCGGTNLITAAAVGGPSSRAGGAVQVVHSARDCTRPGCPPQRAASQIAVLASNGKASPRFQGQVVTPVQSSDNSYLWLAGFVLLVFGVLAAVWKAR